MASQEGCKTSALVCKCLRVRWVDRMVRGLGGLVSFRLVQGCDSQQIHSIQSYDSIDVGIVKSLRLFFDQVMLLLPAHCFPRQPGQGDRGSLRFVRLHSKFKQANFAFIYSIHGLFA